MGTGHAVEKLLPGKVLDIRHTELLESLLLEVDLLQLVDDIEAREVDVRDRRHHMQVFRVGEIVHEAEDGDDMQPPHRLEDQERGFRVGEHRTQQRADGTHRPAILLAGRHTRGIHHQK